MRKLFTALVLALAAQLAAAQNAIYVINIAIVTDWATVESFGGPAATQTALQERVNTASEVYTSQMQLEINVVSWTIPTSAEQPFTATDTQYLTLLNDVALWRESTAGQESAAVTVLMTARTMTDDRVGESFIGQAGDADAASVVEVDFGSYNDGIILAHELGHQLNADHDGDPAGSCGSTAQNVYIMTADSMNNTTGQFSPCSVGVITSSMAWQQAVQPIARQAVAAGATPSSGGGGAFDWLSIAILLTVTLVTRLSCTKE